MKTPKAENQNRCSSPKTRLSVSGEMKKSHPASPKNRRNEENKKWILESTIASEGDSKDQIRVSTPKGGMIFPKSIQNNKHSDLKFYKGESSNSHDFSDSPIFGGGSGDEEYPPLAPVKVRKPVGAVGDPICKETDSIEDVSEEATRLLGMEESEVNSSFKPDDTQERVNVEVIGKQGPNEWLTAAGRNLVKEGKDAALKQAAKDLDAWRTGKASTSLFGNKVPREEQRLKFENPTANKAIITEDMLTNEWDNTLIGYFMGRYPGFYALKELCKSWGVHHEIKTHDSGWILFKFNNENDISKVLNGGPYSIWGRNLMLKKMPFAFHFDDSEISCMPVWIKLRNLPMCCWTNSALQRIASFVGKPLYTDKMSQSKERVSYVRMLVEVDAALPLVREVTVQVPNAEWVQPIEFEFEPRYCIQCRKLGHAVGACPPIETWEERREKYLKREEENRKKKEGGKDRIDKEGYRVVEGKKVIEKKEEWKVKKGVIEKKNEGKNGG